MLHRRSRDEGGVVAITVALLTCFVLIPVCALAVDLGVQRVARGDMQSLADVVALDLARKLDGHTTAAQWTGHTPSLQELADDSSARNTANVGAPATVVPTLGTLDPVTGDFTALDDVSPTVPNAVMVTAATDVHFAIMGGSGGAARTAIAQAESSACFQLGSFAATLTPSAAPLFHDLLAPLIGTSTLGMVGYNGLATADVSLLDVMDTGFVGVGTVDELLAMTDLTVADVYHASAEVLRADGKVAQADVFDAAAASAIGSVVIDAGDLFGLSSASTAALETRFNALDILVGTALLADGQHLVGLPNLQTGLSSIGVTNTDLSIIEKAQRACRVGNEATTAQVRLISQAQVSVSNSPLYNDALGSFVRLIDPATGSPDNQVDLGLHVDIAGAHGHLTSVTCDPDTFEADIWSDLATVNLNGSTHVEGVLAVNIAGIGLVKVPVKLDVDMVADASRPAAVTPVHTSMAFPPSTYGDHVEVGTGGYTLPHLTTTLSTGSVVLGQPTVSGIPVAIPASTLSSALDPVIGLVVSTVSDRVSPIINPFIDKVNGYLDQLTTGLGLNVGGADFFPLPTPSCQSPVLRG